MAQVQRLDAHLDTLSTELYQVNVRVGRITRRQAVMGGFVPEAPPPMASDSKAEDDDDGDASSTDKIST